MMMMIMMMVVIMKFDAGSVDDVGSDDDDIDDDVIRIPQRYVKMIRDAALNIYDTSVEEKRLVLCTQ